MKTYVLTISTIFPKTHKRKGEHTFFSQMILNEIKNYDGCQIQTPNAELFISERKLHTIRANYPLWKKRFEKIDKGNACLSLRFWSGKPYQSKQIEFARLTKDDGIGIQEIDFNGDKVVFSELAKNDGLAIEDFQEWFRNYDLSDLLAIIHFTEFRY